MIDLLRPRRAFIRTYQDRAANVRHVSEMIDHFPYDLLIIATHCVTVRDIGGPMSSRIPKAEIGRLSWTSLSVSDFSDAVERLESRVLQGEGLHQGNSVNSAFRDGFTRCLHLYSVAA